MNRLLWVVQVLLALLFLFAGTMKFIVPMDQMTKQVPLPGLFLYFIGAAEILGAFGLVLPWLLRIKPRLTALAAAGLTVIMVGATAVTLKTGPAAMAALPFVAGILCVFVVWGRRFATA